MCYPSPGPRCSSHAREKLNAVTTEYERISARRSDLESQLEGANLSTQRAYRNSVQAERSAARRVEAARSEWYTTPAGLSELKIQYREATRRGDKQTAEQMKKTWLAGRDRRRQALYNYNRFQRLSKQDQQLRQFIDSDDAKKLSSLGSTYSNWNTEEVGVVLYNPSSSQTAQWRSALDDAGLNHVKVEVLRSSNRKTDDLSSDPDLRRKERLEDPENTE